MPSKLKSGGTFPYVLADERGDDKPAVFMLRVLSCLEEAELTESRDRYFNRGESDASEAEMLGEMLRIALESHSVEGQPDDPRSFLTSRECFQLVAGAIMGAALSADERKKFVSQPASETECSASDAKVVIV
jgi:hypothetical protein